MSSTTAQYEALAQQIESILQNPEAAIAQIKDAGIRRRLVEGGRKLSLAMEEPSATLCSFEYSHLRLPLAVVGADSGIFTALAAQTQPLTSRELSEKTGVNLVLLIDDDAFQANNVTRALGNKYQANALRFSHKISAQGSGHLPEWLQSNGYKDPNGILPTAWQSAIHSDLHGYAWIAENPWAMELSLAHMRVQREGRPVFFDAINLEDRFGNDTTSSTVLFVDIGGALGSQSLTFRQRYPNLAGRVIVQDSPSVVAQAKATLPSSANIEAEEYDIKMPQPVKGARVYYLRNIIHGWPGATCLQPLLSIKTAMTEESVIIIDEIILPEKGCAPRAAERDVELLATLGATERTQAEYAKLLKEAGLKMHEVVMYDDEVNEGVIIAGLK